MSVTIKGVTYDTSKANLNLNWGKYNGNKNATGNGSSDGSGGTAVSLANAPGTPTFRVADYYPSAAYPVRIDYYTGAYNIGWYPLSSLPTAYVTVNFDSGGGTRTYTWGVGGNFPSVSKTGYTHTGWKIDGITYSPTVSVADSWISERAYSGTLSAVAQWSPNPYTISFNANGGTGAPSSVTKYHNTTLTLPTTKPTRSGYTFLGWSASSSATTATWSAGGSYTDNVARTLYAVWQANTTYTVSYNTNGGSGEISSQSGYSGTSVTLWSRAQATPTKADTTATVTITYDKVELDATISKSSDSVTKTTSYTFTNWNTAADGSGTSYEPGQQITLAQNLTLYAQYTSSTSGATDLPTGTLDQYVLQGWSKSETDITILSSPYSPTQDETLYAIWAVNGLGGMLKLPGELTLNEGDTIRLVGTKGDANDGLYTVASASTTGGVTTIYLNEDFPESITQDASALNLEIYGAGTYVPPFDYICEKDNRLWGCSNKTRTIYASALGVPDEFEQFNGTADDSYQLVVATPGDFTGCAAMNSSVIFTKQHYIHKMLGGFPAEYALYTYNIDGASYTNGGSLINMNGTAMYVGEHGVMTYNGSQQSIMSLELGENEFQSARGCFDGEKYLLSALKGSEDVCYVFDTRYGIWLEKDYGGEVKSAVHLRDKDYVLVDGQIYMVNSGVDFEGSWEILFKPFIETIDGVRNTSQQFFQKKRYAHLRFRIELPEESTFVAEIKPDGGDWLTVADMHGINDRVIEFPVYTPRCDKLQLRLSGNGRMTLLGIEREYMVGSAR